MKFPNTAIIMPVYKRIIETEVAIDSVIVQENYHDRKLILVDDNTDAVLNDAVTELSKKDDRIIYVKNDKYPHGIVGPKNLGLEIAMALDTSYISYLDNDDKFRKDKLSIQLEYLEKYKNIGIIGSWCNIIDQQGNDTGQVREYFPEHHDEILKLFTYTCPIWNSSSIFRKEIVETIGYQNPNKKVAADFEWLLRVLKKYQGYNIQEPLIDYRIRDNNFTALSGTQNHKDAFLSLLQYGNYLPHQYKGLIHHLKRSYPQEVNVIKKIKKIKNIIYSVL